MNTQLSEAPQEQVEANHGGAARATVRRLAWVVPAAVLGVSVADIALYEVAGVLDPEVTGWPGAGAAQIVAANAVYLSMAAVALLALVKLTTNPDRWFTVLATVGVIASLALPISAGLGGGTPDVPAPGLTTIIALAVMHLVSYAIAVPMLLRLGRRQRG